MFTVKASTAGDAVFIGGEFETVGGLTLKNLAKLDALTGAPDAGFESNANAYVKDLAVSPDGTRLYVGGAFDSLTSSGVQELVYKLAAVDTTTGALVPNYAMPLTQPTNDQSEGGVRALALTRQWAEADGHRELQHGDVPHPTTHRPVRRLRCDAECHRMAHRAVQPAVRSGPDRLDARHRHIAGRQHRVRRVAGHFYYPACDSTNAFPMAIPSEVRRSSRVGPEPSATPRSPCRDRRRGLHRGHFRFLAREQEVAQRFQIGALDPKTGKPLSWNPNVSGFRGVLVIESEPAGLFVGGDGDTAGGVPHGGVALFASQDPGIEVRVAVDKPLVLQPGGTVNYTFTVTNTDPDRPVTVTTLTDSRLGDLATQCNLPRVVSAGSTCSAVSPAR